MKKSEGCIFISVIVLSIFVFLFFLSISDTSTESDVYIRNNEKYEDNKINDELLGLDEQIDKKYALYKKDIKKYRLGVPKDSYKNLNDRIHQAPDPNGVYQSTLPKGCNLMYFGKDQTDNDVCNMLNGFDTVDTVRLRY